MADRYDQLLATIENAVLELRELLPAAAAAEQSLREAIEEATDEREAIEERAGEEEPVGEQ